MTPSFIRFDGPHSTFVLEAETGGPPQILYWGPALSAAVPADDLALLLGRSGYFGGPSTEAPLCVFGDAGFGGVGPQAFEAMRGDRLAAPRWRVASRLADSERAEILCRDPEAALAATLTIAFDGAAGVLRFDASYTNEGADDLDVTRAALCLAAPANLGDVIAFTGRWAGEFETTRLAAPPGGLEFENRRGRTSHDRFPGLILCAQETREAFGPCLGAHLGWSGNHFWRVETLSDGRRPLILGARLLPGDVRLRSGERFDAPPVFANYTVAGLNSLSAGYHDYFERKVRPRRSAGAVRPVHYNTWEAVYFDHREETLLELIDAAADLGVERFVLDDGWFRGRRGDRAGLGDWTVDMARLSRGLAPLIDRVRARGMSFGLWIEPEMVNVDSDLFRAHPDWILGPAPDAQLPFRSQHVLDLSRQDVQDAVFGAIDALLQGGDIGYLKWDMNRDVSHPHGVDGRACAYRTTLSTYALVDRIAAAHPAVEIEACASGGARADFGMLSRTDRLWTSDNHDPLERLKIQRGASYFFPLSVTGAHIGDAVCHITGRTARLAFRAATAIFGSFGVEADIRKMGPEDRAELKSAIAVYKEKRALIHAGRYYRLDASPAALAHGVVSPDRRSAIFAYAQIEQHKEYMSPPLRLDGLDPQARYRLRMIWPQALTTLGPRPCALEAIMDGSLVAHGEALMKAGIQPPVLFPESAFIFEAIREG